MDKVDHLEESIRRRLSRNRVEGLEKLQETLRYRFRDLHLLERALTHSSYANESSEGRHLTEDYEGLEFLGDSILGFVVSEFLFRQFPGRPEGELSKLKAHLVSARTLASISSELQLGVFSRLSRGEAKTGGSAKPAILCDLFESLVAALYLDGGLETAQSFIQETLRAELERICRGEVDPIDFKSMLQEKLHRSGLPAPKYFVLRAEGPDHDKVFWVAVNSGEDVLGQGRGRSKKEAEQEAARNALAASPG